MPSGLHLDCWHATMKSHPVGELLCASWASFEFLTCPHKILSSQWVAVGLLGSICNFELLTCHYKISSRQWVVVSPGLHLNFWCPTMKYLGGELLCASWPLFEFLTCHPEILSRMWVAMCLLAFIWIADMLLWNLIQEVCCGVPLGLYLNCWYASIKFYPASELCVSCTSFELLTCYYEIPSSWWAVCLLGSIWIANIPLYNPIQDVSCCVPSGLLLNFWHVTMKFHADSELLYISWPLSKLLTCHYHILFSLYLSSQIYSLHPILLIDLQFPGEQCPGSCGHSIQCKIIFHSFQFLSLMYSQLHRCLLCLLSLVWLILLFLLYLWVLTAIWTAILICLEHSFWFVKQGSNASDGFIKAWKFYLKTQCALVDQELNNYLRSIGSNDWFTMKYSPSEEECAECRKIVFNNLLCKSSPCFHWARIANLFSAYPKTSTWSHWNLLEYIVYCKLSVLLDIIVWLCDTYAPMCLATSGPSYLAFHFHTSTFMSV